MANQLTPRKSSSIQGRTPGPFDRLQDQIDRVFADFGRGFDWPDVLRGGSFTIMPSMEVHHEDDMVTVTAELPGMDEKDIDITVSGDTLTVSGEKKSEVEKKDGDYFHSERSYGSFARSVSMPFGIDAGKVKATYDKGVLTLAIEKPVDAKTKSRKIPIGK